MATAAQALAQISSGMTVTQLRTLAGTVDASVGNATLILNSGQVGGYPSHEISQWLSEASDTGLGKTVKTIADTEISSFLNDPAFNQALIDATNDPAYQGPPLSEILDGKDANGNRVNSTSFWDDASYRLSHGHTGDYELIMPDAPETGIAIQREIPALFDKTPSTGQKVNGINLQDWQANYDANKALAIAGGMTSQQAETFVRGEINDLILQTSKANLADLTVGKDLNNILHIDTTNTYLGQSFRFISISTSIRR
jgi:hypothetical protein